MKKINIYLLTLVLTLIMSSSTHSSESKFFKYRWVFIKNTFSSDHSLEKVTTVLEEAKRHGFNGAVFYSNLESLALRPLKIRKRFQKIKEICANLEIEIIPSIFSVGYGESILAYNKNLAAGFPAKNVKFIIENGQPRQIVNHITVTNGDFEKYIDNKLLGIRFQDKAGEITYIDKAIFHSGKVSLRIKNNTDIKKPLGRVSQKISVSPYRRFRLSCWMKSQNLVPTKKVMLQIYAKNGARLGQGSINPTLASSQDWTKVEIAFNSMNNSEVYFVAGVWGLERGTLWVDEITIENETEYVFSNILRRPGTPVTVRNSNTGFVYVEGQDYDKIIDHNLTFRYDHPAPILNIMKSGKIKEGDELLVSFYHGERIENKQTSICMSEPEVYKIWDKQLKQIAKSFAPKYYLLHMDEIRQGGSCEACKNRKLTMGEILGTCITNQYKIIKKYSPKAKVFVWSDMLNPDHNARKDYFMVDGDFSNSWKYIPNDINLVCWSYKKSKKCVEHFSNNNFRILGSVDVDSSPLQVAKSWVTLLREYDDTVGIMFTSWDQEFTALGEVGDIFSGKPLSDQ